MAKYKESLVIEGSDQEAAFTALRADLATAKERLLVFEREAGAYREQIDGLTFEVTTTKKKCSHFEGYAKELENKLQTAESKIIEKEKQLEAANYSNSALREQIAKSRSVVEVIHKSKDDKESFLRRQLNALSSQLTEKTNALLALQFESRRAEETYREKMNELIQRGESDRARLEKAEKLIRSLHSALKTQVEQGRNESQALMALEDERNMSAITYASELSEIRDNLSMKEDQVLLLEDKLAETVRQLNDTSLTLQVSVEKCSSQSESNIQLQTQLRDRLIPCLLQFIF